MRWFVKIARVAGTENALSEDRIRVVDIQLERFCAALAEQQMRMDLAEQEVVSAR